MTWETFYLFCFAFGFLFSLVAVLSGHLHSHGGHHGDVHTHVHVDPHTHGHGNLHSGAHHPSPHAAPSATPSAEGCNDAMRPHVSPFNAGTLSAFLAWFGGTGYLATKMYSLLVVTTLTLSIVSGLIGASIIFWFLSRVLMREREELDPADYSMVGMLGQVSGAIRENGIGEIIYTQAGARRGVPARSDATIPIPIGVEVVVTRFENGIAYVSRWEDFAGTANAVTERPR